MYVDDLAQSCIFLLENNVDYELINSGTGKEITIKEFSELIKKVVGYKGKITFDNTKPDGTLNKRLDTSIINKLGWKPKTDLKIGLKKTYKWAIEKKVFDNM